MSEDDARNPPPDALLYMGTHCPYCATVLRGLEALQADGVIGDLQTVNIEEQPEAARAAGVRSVPLVRIGPYQLEGLRSEQELRTWATQAGTRAGTAAWLDELLGSGKIAQALELVETEADAPQALLTLFADPDTRLNTRIGISAIMEDLAGSERLRRLVGRLGELTRHPEARVRGDACHYLELAGDPAGIEYLRPRLEDADAQVREVARDALRHLEARRAGDGKD